MTGADMAFIIDFTNCTPELVDAGGRATPGF
jgi:hypothetical protein